MMHQELSALLRQFLGNLLMSKEKEESGSSRPVVSVARLTELDVLGARLHSILAETTSADDLADFGLREARQCRKQWASFADRCWEYVAHSCKVEKVMDP